MDDNFFAAYTLLQKDHGILIAYVLKRKSWSRETAEEVVQTAFDVFLSKRAKVQSQEIENIRRYFFGVLRIEVNRKNVELYHKWLLSTGGEDAVLHSIREKERLRWYKRIAKIRADPNKLEAYRERHRKQWAKRVKKGKSGKLF